jgi:translation initiation factor 4E
VKKLSHNSNYHLFKEGIEPMWEDPQNKDGGKFVLTLPKQNRMEGRTDECWLYTVLAVIGETMDLTGEEVCGCVVSIRKSADRIALWLKSSDKQRCTDVSDASVCTPQFFGIFLQTNNYSLFY